MIPEEEPFEIQDFSVATPWEQLVATIELHLRAWAGAANPPPPLDLLAQLGGASPHPSTVRCVLSCHGSLAAGRTSGAAADQPTSIDEQLLRTEGSLHSDAFSMVLPDRLHRWYGVSALVLLCPSDPAGSLDASEMAALQSALCTAAGACGCEAPLFVLHESSTAGVCGRAMGAARVAPAPPAAPVGGCDAGAVCTRFDVKCFEAVPDVLRGDRALPALCHLFRSKVGAAGGACGPVSIAVRVTLVLDQWTARQKRRGWGSSTQPTGTPAAPASGCAGSGAPVDEVEQHPQAARLEISVGARVELPLTAWGDETAPAGRPNGLNSWGGRASWSGGGGAGGGGLANLALAC
eukprot:scaffold8036_cov128-Isochrysis_galbana.AAC.1